MRDFMFGSKEGMQRMLDEKSAKRDESALKSQLKRDKRREKVDEFLNGIGKAYNWRIWDNYVQLGKGKFQELKDLALAV